MRRRRRRRSFRLGPFFVFALFVLSCSGPLYYLQPPRRSGAGSRTHPAAAPADTPVRSAAVYSPRRIYPYSVIRGGAYSAAELVRALDSDPVVMTHYSDFNTSAVRPIRAANSRIACLRLTG